MYGGIFIIFLLLIAGITIYSVRPKIFFLYWLSIYPYILPILYRIFRSELTPILERFQPILRYYPALFFYLMLLLFLKSNKGFKNKDFFLIPLILLFLFLIAQNIIVGIDILPLWNNIRDVLFIIASFVLLIVNKTVRPNRKTLIKYIVVFVYIQCFFCILNLLGFRIYETIRGGFEDLLISGTFMRYNHMANYLAIFFFILSFEYNEYKGIKRTTYYLTSILIGLLIIMSGSRMTVLLYCFTVLFYIFIYQRLIIKLLAFGVFSLLLTTYIIGNKSFVGEKGDEATGVERNVIGIVNVANSDDLSEGSTLSLSAYLLYTKFGSPIIGNGKVYRKDYFYGIPGRSPFTEGVYKVDARLAFMLVEYGFLGIFLFFLLYASIFKGCYLYSEEHVKRLYWGVVIYLFLFSITDSGFWDETTFSIILIYMFSIKRKTPETSYALRTTKRYNIII